MEDAARRAGPSKAGAPTQPTQRAGRIDFYAELLGERYPRDGITGDPFLDGFIWGRGTRETANRVRCTVSTRPFPLLEDLRVRAERLGLAVSFLETGVSAGEGSLVMELESTGGEFASLPSSLAMRSIDSSDEATFLTGFFASRLNKGQVMMCAWNSGGTDLAKTLGDLGADVVEEKEGQFRIRGWAKIPAFAPYVDFVRQERTHMKQNSPAPSVEEPGETGWLSWEGVSPEDRADYLKVAEVLRERGPSTFAMLQRSLATVLSNDIRIRVVLGRAMRYQDLPHDVPRILKVAPQPLENLRTRMPIRGTRPKTVGVYVVKPPHSEALAFLASCLANSEMVPLEEHATWARMEKEAASFFPKKIASGFDWEKAQFAFRQFMEGRLDWLGISLLFPPTAEESAQTIDSDVIAGVAAFLRGIGSINGPFLDIVEQTVPPETADVISWTVRHSGRPNESELTGAMLSGRVPLPTFLQDAIRLLPAQMDEGATAMLSETLFNKIRTTMPPPITDSPRKSNPAARIPKWLKGNKDRDSP